MSMNINNSEDSTQSVKIGITKEQMLEKLDKKQKEKFELIFNKFDKEKDGFLNESELDEAYQYLKGADKNGDNTVSKKELKNAMEASRRKDKRADADMYDQFFNRLADVQEGKDKQVSKKEQRQADRAEAKETKEAAKEAKEAAKPENKTIADQKTALNNMMKNLTKDFEVKSELKTELATVNLEDFAMDHKHKTSFGEILDNIIKARYNVTDQKDVAAIRAQLKEVNGIAKNATDIPKSIKMPDTLKVGEKDYTYKEGKVNVSREGFYFQEKSKIEGAEGESVIKKFGADKNEIGGTRYVGNDKAFSYENKKDDDGKINVEYKDQTGKAIEPQVNAEKKVGFVESGTQKYYFETAEDGTHKPIIEAKYNEVTAPPAPKPAEPVTPIPPASPTVPSDSTAAPEPPPLPLPAPAEKNPKIEKTTNEAVNALKDKGLVEGKDFAVATATTSGTKDESSFDIIDYKGAQLPKDAKRKYDMYSANGFESSVTVNKSGKSSVYELWSMDGALAWSTSTYPTEKKSHNDVETRVFYDDNGKASVKFVYDGKQGVEMEETGFKDDGKTPAHKYIRTNVNQDNFAQEFGISEDGTEKLLAQREFNENGMSTKEILYNPDGKTPACTSTFDGSKENIRMRYEEGDKIKTRSNPKQEKFEEEKTGDIVQIQRGFYDSGKVQAEITKQGNVKMFFNEDGKKSSKAVKSSDGYVSNSKYDKNGEIVSNDLAQIISAETNATLWSNTRYVNDALSRVNEDNVIDVLIMFNKQSPDKGLMEACDDIINGPGQNNMVPVAKTLLRVCKDQSNLAAASKLEKVIADAGLNAENTSDFPSGVAKSIDEVIAEVLKMLK